MPVSLVALVAAAIYQVRSSLADPEAMDRTLGLVVRANDGAALSLEIHDPDLVVNGARIPVAAPGATILHRALVDHHTGRLFLPGGLTPRQWRDVVELYASMPGLFTSLDEVRDALRSTVPEAIVSGASDDSTEIDLREALFELPGLRATSGGTGPVRPPDSRDAEFADLTSRLDPLLQAAARARDARDYAQLAQTLLQMRELEERSNDDLRAVVARERRRVVPTTVLDGMARTIPRPGVSPDVSRILGSLGREGTTALLDALSGAPGQHERRAYIDALVACREGDGAIIEALGSARAQLAQDAAEVVGRKRLEQAVPVLTHMLKHSQESVRTAAWHALDLIGTRDAMKALRT